jgi:toxin ParE1/3/4
MGSDRNWRYTFLRWGLAQADAYLDEIEEAVGRIRTYPDSGTDCSELLAGARRIRVGRHHIYYLIKPDRVDVVRVLDVRQDAPRHLLD